MKLHFINYCHNGDIHYSKRFMLDLYNIIGPEECYLHHVNSPRLIADMPFIKSELPILDSKVGVIMNSPTNSQGKTPSDFLKAAGIPTDGKYFCDNAIIGEDVYIVTWLAYYYFGKDSIPSNRGCSIYTNLLAYKRVYEELEIKNMLKPLEFYIPKIDYSYFETKNIDIFHATNQTKKVLISNGKTLSGQAADFSFDPAISVLATKYPDISFILTHQTQLQNSNIYYTSNIINKTGNDLNEISYLSLQCDVIIGRGSGPQCFTHVRENYFDTKKVMVSFSHSKDEGFWFIPENRCKILWTSFSDFDSIYTTIDKAINL